MLTMWQLSVRGVNRPQRRRQYERQAKAILTCVLLSVLLRLTGCRGGSVAIAARIASEALGWRVWIVECSVECARN